MVVAVKVTLVQDAVRAVEGEPPDVTVVVKLTVPVKPPVAVTVSLSLPVEPAAKVIVAEVCVRVKSAAELTVNGSQPLVAPLLLASPEWTAFQLKDPAVLNI